MLRVHIAQPRRRHAHTGLRNAYSAFSAEALQLPDAELRLNSKFDKVWGNSAFEDGAPQPPVALTKPGSIKMNNLFDDPSTRERHMDQSQSPQHNSGPLHKRGTARHSGSDEGAVPGAEARGPSIVNLFKGNNKSQRELPLE